MDKTSKGFFKQCTNEYRLTIDKSTFKSQLGGSTSLDTYLSSIQKDSCEGNMTRICASRQNFSQGSFL